ncbi:MAG: hypothetical protein JW751_00975 [Polyangiaceae bacterium]|nr:hypothetical protein [Polyangiaceae bacterium]
MSRLFAHPTRRRFAGLALLMVGSIGTTIVTSVVAGPAQAQVDSDPAVENERLHDLFERAGQALDDEDYTRATELLLEVWRARRTADVAANLAVAELETGAPAAAGRHASFAKRHLLPSATPEQRDRIEILLARARSEAAVLVITVEPPTAEVSVGGERIEPEEFGQLFVMPGEQVIVGRVGSAENEHRVTVARGARQPVTIKVDVTADAEPPAPARRSALPATSEPEVPRADERSGRGPSLVPLLVSVGVAAVGGGMAIGFGVAADRVDAKADDTSAALVKDDPDCDPTEEPDCPDWVCHDSSDPRCADLRTLRKNELRDRDLELAGVITAGVGVTAALASGIVYAARRHARLRAARRPTVSVRCAAAPGTGYLGVHVSF